MFTWEAEAGGFGLGIQGQPGELKENLLLLLHSSPPSCENSFVSQWEIVNSEYVSGSGASVLKSCLRSRDLTASLATPSILREYWGSGNTVDCLHDRHFTDWASSLASSCRNFVSSKLQPFQVLFSICQSPFALVLLILNTLTWEKHWVDAINLTLTCPVTLYSYA